MGTNIFSHSHIDETNKFVQSLLSYLEGLVKVHQENKEIPDTGTYYLMKAMPTVTVGISQEVEKYSTWQLVLMYEYLAQICKESKKVDAEMSYTLMPVRFLKSVGTFLALVGIFHSLRHVVGEDALREKVGRMLTMESLDYLWLEHTNDSIELSPKFPPRTYFYYKNKSLAPKIRNSGKMSVQQAVWENANSAMLTLPANLSDAKANKESFSKIMVHVKLTLPLIDFALK